MRRRSVTAVFIGLLTIAAGASAVSALPIPTVGDGWDGPGLGSATVTYHLAAPTLDLPLLTQKSTLASALGVWSSVAALTFIETSLPALTQSIDFLFTLGDHGDGFPFGVFELAHTFFPSPPNPEPIAADVHFNDAFLFEVGDSLGFAAFDLMWLAVHETGHSLGLGHSDDPDSVMFQFVGSEQVFTGLHPADIQGIRSLYATTPTVPQPTTLALVVIGLALAGAWVARKPESAKSRRR